MSDTPRTDAGLIEHCHAFAAPVEITRQLERELTKALADLWSERERKIAAEAERDQAYDLAEHIRASLSASELGRDQLRADLQQANSDLLWERQHVEEVKAHSREAQAELQADLSREKERADGLEKTLALALEMWSSENPQAQQELQRLRSGTGNLRETT